MYNIDSKLYRWDGTSFAVFQSIPTNGTYGWKFFTIGSDHYLAVANQYNDSTRNIDSKIYKAVDKTLLSVHVLAVDNAPESDLSWTVPSAITEIAAATAADANKHVLRYEVTALVLVDEPGDGNTVIHEVRNGVATAISGLPDTSGALTTSITEYNTADGATLGGFLLWARNTYTADQVTFSYVGHGGPLVPEADYSQIFGSTLRAAAANGMEASRCGCSPIRLTQI